MSYYPNRNVGDYYHGSPDPAAPTPIVPSYGYSVSEFGSATSSANTLISPPYSGGGWNQQDDRALLELRAMGKSWNHIRHEAFPNKTANACRNQHERLLEHRGQNDFDNRKLERLSKEYMSMRKEIWQPLAARCGEKWNVVEAQVC